MKSFKIIIPLLVLALVAAVLLAAATPLMAGGKPNPGGTYKVVAWNDLGMHCACPSFAGFLLLPPFNTIRAQVFQFGPNDPVVVTSANAATLGLTIGYNMIDNTDALLQGDTYFKQWITYSPKLFPGFQPVVGGKVQGLAGFGLSGNMAYDSNLLDWKAVGIPAYPLVSSTPSLNIMTDPLGGPNRNPYPVTNVFVKNASGTVVAQTNTVTPVAFGGCCTCHLKLAAANGYPATPAGSFTYLGVMHGRNSSGINIAMIDPDGDGVGGPVRCSWCHWDPAMGEAAAPGWPAGTKLLPGAGTLKKSVYSFSDVLHRFHTQDPLVLTTAYDPNIAKNCYDCHPGNNVNCYRGAHVKTNTGIWCTDCHGDLNQRVAAGQLTQPWKTSTLPSCIGPASGITSAFPCHASRDVGGRTYPTTPELFGKFINSRGHKGSIRCQTCHGEAHAEAPSAMALDNVQLQTLQGAVAGVTYPTGKNSSYALGACQFCHPGKSTTWQKPPHN
jgi:hypothetical protein